ncbi:2465_t:CDS:1 [Cetraspora pellucida]|uniref:2465_t:CDS:1 n=1 Tax=Cetraspora pellucida TaxID=1433469 RepID=A0A9N9BWJ9_9GLOM|nr:2465_t:CDS:1 [Cetraspora pellucida]
MIQTNVGNISLSNIDISQLKPIIERFMSYPDSRIKDFLVEREIRRIQNQAQIFENLTISSIDRSKSLSKSYELLLKGFEKNKPSLRGLTKFLQNSSSISSFLNSELTTTKMFQECERIRMAYYDISKNLSNISDNLEDRVREFKIQKFDLDREALNLQSEAKQAQAECIILGGSFGVFVGIIAGVGVGTYTIPFDGGVVFLSTIIASMGAGSLFGQILEEKINQSARIKFAKAEKIYEKVDYVNKVIEDVESFKSGVQKFERFWTGHVEHFTSVQRIIDNSSKGVDTDLKSINVQTIFNDWNRAKNSLYNYGISVERLQI